MAEWGTPVQSEEWGTPVGPSDPSAQLGQDIERLPVGATLRPIPATPSFQPSHEPESRFSQTNLIREAIAPLEDVGIGALKGFGHTVSGTAGLLGKIPLVGKILSPPQGTAALESLSTPTNTPQEVGYYGEQIGEFMLPGAAEESGTLKVATKLPMLGKFALPASRIATGALSSGIINKLQGGDFGTGAAAGGLGGIAGEAVKGVAPQIIERAIGVGPKQLIYGAKPGEEALKLPGIMPKTIRANADSKALALTRTKLEPMLQAADNAGTTIDLTPARDKIQTAITEAEKRNSKPVVERLTPLLEQLRTDMAGNPIPNVVLPTQARALKQGLDDTINSWTSERGGVSGRVTGAAKGARSVIDKALDTAIPGHEEVNKQIQSLIAASKGRGSGRIGILGRVALPYLGYQVARQEGATPGQSVGAALAMEGLSSPAARIIIAKGLPKAIPAIRGGALQIDRGKRTP